MIKCSGGLALLSSTRSGKLGQLKEWDSWLAKNCFYAIRQGCEGNTTSGRLFEVDLCKNVEKHEFGDPLLCLGFLL